MKAVSPMIATVLLIPFVAGIGAILALWFPSIIQKITSPTQVETKKLLNGFLKCQK